MNYSNIEKININTKIPEVKTEIPKSVETINISFNNPVSNQTEVFCQKYNITPEQYQILSQKYDLKNLQEIEIQAIVNKEFPKTEVTQQPEEVKSSDVSASDETSSKPAENKQPVEEQQPFNHKEYSALSNEQKVNVYAQELAKNKFIYNANGQKSLEEWNALSEQEKQNLINAELKNIVKENSEGLFDDKTISKILQQKMTSLQAANRMEMNLDKFNACPDEQKQEYRHDYIFDLNYFNPDNMSEGQQRYFKTQENISEAVIAACRKNGIDLGDGTYIMPPEEVKQRLEELGINSVQVRIDYLSDLEKSGKVLSDEQKNELAGLKKMEGFANAVEKLPNENYGRMEALSNSKYGELWNSAAEPADKMNVLKMYIKNEYGNLSPEEKHKAVTELASEIVHNDAELGKLFHENLISGATKKEQNAYVDDDSVTVQLLNSVNVNAFEEDVAGNLALKQKEISKKNAELGRNLASITLDNADEPHLTATSSTYSAFGDKVIEDKHVEVAYDKDRVGAKAQNLMLSNTYKNSNIETQKQAAINTDKAYKENQVDLTRKASENKEVNDAMIEDGTFSRYAKENQTEAFKIHKTRCEQNDYSKEDSIRSLNKLSDSISKCDPSNQLDMHKEVMTSKYSEVQEHAASNIKDYADTVKTQAMDSVYATGNQKAINAAIDNMTSYKSPDVVNQEIIRISGEAGISSKDLQQKMLSGTLSSQEIAKLTPGQRRTYFMDMFKKATPAQKLEYIKKGLGNLGGSQKKTLYTIIARFSPNLLKGMIDGGLGKSMIEAGVPLDVVNAIITVMKNSTNNEVIEQLKDLKSDKNLEKYFEDDNATSKDYPPIAKTVQYTSIPTEFSTGVLDTKYIFAKDKSGHLLG